MQGPGQRGEGAVGIGTSGLGGEGGQAEATKKLIFEFFWGRERGVPGRGRQRRELGGGS